jgi:transcriptional repressor NrdR
MRCPFCQNEDTQVKDSRPTEDGAAIRRRRQCDKCGSRFTTFERVQLRDLTVVKRSGRRVPFDRDKLARSLAIALRKRPIEQDQIEQTETIGEMVMEALAHLDPVAYVRYASVYRDFRDTSDFGDFIEEAGKTKRPAKS